MRAAKPLPTTGRKARGEAALEAKMIVLLEANADAKAVGAALQGLGQWIRPLHGAGTPVVIAIEPQSAAVSVEQLLAIPGVAQVRAPTSAHPRVDNLPRTYDLALNAGGVVALGREPVLVAGPCAVESREQIFSLARIVADAGGRLLRGGAFKPRTSPYSFAGAGPQALQWLAEAAREFGLGVVTEAMSELHVDAVAEVADLIQIGSRNMQNYALLAAVGRTGRPALLKRSRGASIEEWLQAGEHLLVHGSPWVLFCERGVAGLAGETRNTLDLAAVALLHHAYGLTVAVDPSHGTGRRDLVVPMAKAGVAAGAGVVLVEIHTDPGKAKSDGPQALLPGQLRELADAFALAPLVRPNSALPPPTSRYPEFYKKSVQERRQSIIASLGLSPDAQRYLRSGQLDIDIADKMSENVISTFALPLALGLNFRINGRDHLVPMVVEEPSVVAAASNAARMVRMAGGFRGDATASVMTAQVQFDHVAQPAAALQLVHERRDALMAAANGAIPRMVARGGGCIELDARLLDEASGLIVVHLYVDVGDAMGANVVDSVAECVAPLMQSWFGGTVGLRILSNLPLRRLVHVECDVATEVLGGGKLADALVRASHFAEVDPFRAATHNKGILNGIDAVAVALGQDWRAVEAGAHAYAGLGSDYRPLATWARTPTGIHGTIELPLAIGTVGGSTQAHPGVRTAMEIIKIDSARELAVVMAAVGLASNLAALRALAGEGIQHGHMKLHARKHEIELPPPGKVEGPT